MKKLALALAAVATLSSCGGTRTIVVEKVVDDTQVDTPTTEIQTTEAPKSGIDTYVDNVIYMYPDVINSRGRNWVVELGYTICEAIDTGMSLDDLVVLAMRANADAEMVGFITGEAIRNLCPEHQWFIDAAGA